MKNLAQFLRESSGQRISMRSSNKPYSINKDQLILNRNSRESRANIMKFNKISSTINEILIKLIDLNSIFIDNKIKIFTYVTACFDDNELLKLNQYGKNDFALSYYNRYKEDSIIIEENSDMIKYLQSNKDLIFADDINITVGGKRTDFTCIKTETGEFVTEQNFDIRLYNITDNVRDNLLKTPFCKNAIIDGKTYYSIVQFNIKDADKVCKMLKTYINKY